MKKEPSERAREINEAIARMPPDLREQLEHEIAEHKPRKPMSALYDGLPVWAWIGIGALLLIWCAVFWWYVAEWLLGEGGRAK